jgi:hypothetical protein
MPKSLSASLHIPTFMLVVYLCGVPPLYGNCEPPAYREAKSHPNSMSYALVDIAVQPQDLAPERLICLASILKERYRGSIVSVNIFDSYEAALKYEPPSSEYTRDTISSASSRHANYFSNPAKHEEYILLIPDGRTPNLDSPFNTRIDLPATGKPSCKLQIQGRCLLEFEHIELPGKQGPGSVTLTGQINPDGTVSQVAVLDPDANDSSPRITLAEFATRNLRSWRFEPSATKDQIKIVYALERRDIPDTSGLTVQFALPDRIDLRMSR